MVWALPALCSIYDPSPWGKQRSHAGCAAVNCVDHEDICSAHSVRSYPTLKLYPGEVSTMAPWMLPR